MNSQLHNQIKQLSDRELLEGIYQMLLVVMQEQLVSDTLSNYEFKCSTVTVNNWYKDLQYTPQFELFVAPGTGTHNQSSNYFTDYTFSSNSIANRTVFIGGHLGNGSNASWFSLRSTYGLGNSYADIE